MVSLNAKAADTTLSAIQTRKTLNCVVITEEVDWNREDLHGDLTPLAEEVCRAVAVATLGRGDRLQVLREPAEPEALTALHNGLADLVVGVTPAISTALRLDVAYGPPVFLDTQQILVHRDAGIHDIAGLAGNTVCFIAGTDTAGVLLAATRARGIAIRPFPFQEEGEMSAAFTGGRCQAISAYASRLAAMRLQFRGDYVLLPDRLALSPVVVATRAGDVAWSAVVAATVDVLIQAQMLGVTQAGIVQAMQSDDPVLARLTGRDWSSGLALGLAHDWSAKVIAAVGNYGEIYDRTLGTGSNRQLPAGLNTDCLHGGALCPAQVK